MQTANSGSISAFPASLSSAAPPPLLWTVRARKVGVSIVKELLLVVIAASIATQVKVSLPGPVWAFYAPMLAGVFIVGLLAVYFLWLPYDDMIRVRPAGGSLKGDIEKVRGAIVDELWDFPKLHPQKTMEDFRSAQVLVEAAAVAEELTRTIGRVRRARRLSVAALAIVTVVGLLTAALLVEPYEASPPPTVTASAQVIGEWLGAFAIVMIVLVGALSIAGGPEPEGFRWWHLRVTELCGQSEAEIYFRIKRWGATRLEGRTKGYGI